MLDLVVDARPAAIAHGFDVRRNLPYHSRPMVALEPRTLMLLS